jgi:signal peptidase I
MRRAFRFPRLEMRLMTEKKRREIIAGWVDLLNGLVPHGGIVELPVLSGSMSPLIKPGSTIRIRSISGKDIHVGDIIVFKEGTTLTTHRLLARMFGAPLLYQKGDANRFGGLIRRSQVVGIVDAVQDTSGAYIKINGPATKTRARKEAVRQIFLALWNTTLIIPRYIKYGLKKKK